MPTEEKHLQQYKRNKNLLNKEIFDITDSTYYDWTITIAFYCAVHLVEKELSTINIHNENHNDRKNTILKVKKTKNISAQYVLLEIQSRRARYNCAKINKKDVEEVFGHLSQIEKELT